MECVICRAGEPHDVLLDLPTTWVTGGCHGESVMPGETAVQVAGALRAAATDDGWQRAQPGVVDELRVCARGVAGATPESDARRGTIETPWRWPDGRGRRYRSTDIGRLRKVRAPQSRLAGNARPP